MIYFTYFFGTVIIGTLMFIYFTLRWFIDEKLKTYRMQFFAPPIIERAYRGKDFFASFLYSTEEMMMRNPYPRNPDEIIIANEEHKKWIMEKYSLGLVRQMFDAKCIEVKEEDDRHSPNPYTKRVDLRVKVYQPEN